jgi:hypothetical protein
MRFTTSSNLAPTRDRAAARAWRHGGYPNSTAANSAQNGDDYPLDWRFTHGRFDFDDPR